MNAPRPTLNLTSWLTAPILIVALLTTGAVLKLLPLLQNFDTVHVRYELRNRADTAGARLDETLLSHLVNLSYIRSFDHVFERGSRATGVERRLFFDRCEVRQGDFYKFTGWLPFHPQQARHAAAPGQPGDWRHFSDTREHLISGRLDAPANGVTWFDAYAYCRAAGGRLPRAEEWIAAAAGEQARLYPWGDDFIPDPWPYLDPLLNAAQKCGAHPETNTPKGIADMGHNVSEWAASADGEQAMIMGGNAHNAPRELYGVSILHRRAPRDYRSPYLGFRCVYDKRPEKIPWLKQKHKAVALAPGNYPTGVPEDALLPSLIVNLPSKRLELIQKIFGHGDDAARTPDFHITVREITRRQYDDFLGDIFVIAGLYAEQNQPADHSYRPPDWDEQMRTPDLPVVNVDWWSAYAFASWAGGRLPSAEEWALVASGGGQRVYPWGNRFAGGQPVSGELRAGGPQSGASERGDLSLDGLLDMGGNVSEWTRSVSGVSGAYSMIVKGGNYLLPGAETARMDFSNYVSPHYRSPTIGFRVVFDRAR